MHRMCDFFVPRDRRKPHTRGTRIASIASGLSDEFSDFDVRTWYTDCVSNHNVNCIDYSSHLIRT